MNSKLAIVPAKHRSHENRHSPRGKEPTTRKFPGKVPNAGRPSASASRYTAPSRTVEVDEKLAHHSREQRAPIFQLGPGLASGFAGTNLLTSIMLTGGFAMSS